MIRLKSKNGMHDGIVGVVMQRLWNDRNNKTMPKLERIIHHRYYNLIPKGVMRVGEIDLFALYNNNYVLKFEIKTNHTKKGYKKALEQLNRSDYLFRNKRVFNLYVHSTNNKGLVYEWVR